MTLIKTDIICDWRLGQQNAEGDLCFKIELPLKQCFQSWNVYERRIRSHNEKSSINFVALGFEYRQRLDIYESLRPVAHAQFLAFSAWESSRNFFVSSESNLKVWWT